MTFTISDYYSYLLYKFQYGFSVLSFFGFTFIFAEKLIIQLRHG